MKKTHKHVQQLHKHKNLIPIFCLKHPLAALSMLMTKTTMVASGNIVIIHPQKQVGTRSIYMHIPIYGYAHATLWSALPYLTQRCFRWRDLVAYHATFLGHGVKGIYAHDGTQNASPKSIEASSKDSWRTPLIVEVKCSNKASFGFAVRILEDDMLACQWQDHAALPGATSAGYLERLLYSGTLSSRHLCDYWLAVLISAFFSLCFWNTFLTFTRQGLSKDYPCINLWFNASSMTMVAQTVNKFSLLISSWTNTAIPLDIKKAFTVITNRRSGLPVNLDVLVTIVSRSIKSSVQ